MSSYITRPGWSKQLQEIEADSPSEAAYLAEGSGEPLMLLPMEVEGEWRFRRFDESDLWAFTVKVRRAPQ